MLKVVISNISREMKMELWFTRKLCVRKTEERKIFSIEISNTHKKVAEFL